MKFYYTNRPQGTRKWHQNWNWTPIETFLLVKSIDFQEFWNSTNNEGQSAKIGVQGDQYVPLRRYLNRQ